MLHDLDLVDVAALIRDRKLSSVEATEQMLARIEALEPTLHAYTLVTPEAALAQAKAVDAAVASGTALGPLAGVPIAVKDLCWTEGIPTRAGMPLYGGFRPERDATVVARLKAAGAVILGKLELTEGAYAGYHPEVVPPVCPWGAEVWPGSSSSGSGVAAAAGLCFGSLGTDTGGSIRYPCAQNGVTGLKPTWGRVSRYGVFELAATLDHVGPMTRSVRDCAAMLGVIAGADPLDPTCSSAPVPDYTAALDGGLAGLRIGFVPNLAELGADAETVATVEAAVATLGRLGATLVEVRLPTQLEQILADWFPACGIETAVAHEATYPSAKPAYGPGLTWIIELGRTVTPFDLHKIWLRRLAFKGEMEALFRTIDCLAVPIQGMAGPTVAEMDDLGTNLARIFDLLRFSSPANTTGQPALCLPAGMTSTGRPIGFQLIGRHFEEDVLFRAGEAWQRATDWHRRRPVL